MKFHPVKFWTIISLLKSINVIQKVNQNLPVRLFILQILQVINVITLMKSESVVQRIAQDDFGCIQ